MTSRTRCYARDLTGVLAILASFALCLVACAAEQTASCEAGMCPDARIDGGQEAGPTTRPTDLIALHISPENPVVRISDGDPHAFLTFEVMGEQRDHHLRHVDAIRFQLADMTFGDIDSMTGTVRASGLGGVTTVRVSTIDGTGLWTETPVTFDVSHLVMGTGVVDADISRFATAMPAPDSDITSPVIDYPLEGAVMPRNVHPPHAMWTARHSAASDDLYRVRLERAHVRVDGYFRATDWDIGAAFTSLAGSEVGTPISMHVTVLSAGTVRDSAPRTFRTIDGVVAGSVYYWSPPRGRLLRIDVDTATRVDFLPNPPGGCIACHAVSRDGRRLVAVTDDGRPMTSYDLTSDLSASPPPSRFREASGQNNVGSFNGDGSRVVTTGYTGGDLGIIDTASGTLLPGVSAGTGTDPEWSPDSSLIAYSRDNNLWVTPAMAGDHFGTPFQIHDATTLAGGGVDWHPTFSPDSRWIVFQHGDVVWTRGSGSLFAISRDGGAPIRLDHANGAADETDSFRPVFSPFNSGGYFWVLFTSSRPYGNASAGVRGHKLIWVAAFRNRPEPGVDPSEAPYFLDGQEPSTNISPYWAPPPCRDNGTTCSTGGDCCSGTCDADSGGSPTCRSPMNSCRPRGSSCSASSDCCSGSVCTDARICDVPEPG